MEDICYVRKKDKHLYEVPGEVKFTGTASRSEGYQGLEREMGVTFNGQTVSV